MSRRKKFLMDLQNFKILFPEDEVVQINNEFKKAVEDICDALIHVEIVYTSLCLDSCMDRMGQILEYLSSIMNRFLKADMAEPLIAMNFNLFMKLSLLTTKLKTLIVTEQIDDGFIFKNDDHLFNYETEQHICDTYKIKLQSFKIKSEEVEIYTINQHFTYFLIEYVRLLSKLKNNDSPLEKNVQLLSEVADVETLVKNFNFISDILPLTSKIVILKKITNSITKGKFDLRNNDLLQSKNKDFKSEICVVTFFTLQNICKYLENEKLNQSSQILSNFDAESIISSIGTHQDHPIKSTFEESTKLFTFKTYKNIKEVPSKKIKKCLKVLKTLLISLSGHKEQFVNCPFALILLSILSEFVTATNLDNSAIMMLVEIIIGFLDICKLPMSFLPVSFAFKIYQKIKSDDILAPKSLQFFKILSKKVSVHKLQQQSTVKDLNEIININSDSIDKVNVVSCFLDDIQKIDLDKQKIIVDDIYYTLNEFVIMSSQYTCSTNPQLVYPYSISLNFSIKNKKESTVFENLAVLDDYIAILFNKNVKVEFDDKKYLLNTILHHYEDIVHCIPNDFLVKCWEYVINPINMDINTAITLLKLCSSHDLIQFINILKMETIKLIERNEPAINEDYYNFINELWCHLLKIQLINQKKKIRKDNINHFCFVLNRTFIFNTNKIQTEQGLILLLKLVCLLLKLPWINKTTMICFSLRIMTFVEKSSSKALQLLIEASELLIVLYKCPNNAIKSYLGLYVTTFANVLKKCLLSSKSSLDMLLQEQNYFIPFHKLEKCSSLFKQNKNDFDIICRYIIEDIIEVVAVENSYFGVIMRHFYNIIFNLMDVCSPDEMKNLMLSIQGPSLLVLRNAYKQYRTNVRFVGRL